MADDRRLATSASARMGTQTKVTKIRGARVLVADDNNTNQRVAQMILESGGHRPTIVDNGEQALDALERGGFDIALFDLSMPVVSGLPGAKDVSVFYFKTNTRHHPVCERHYRNYRRMPACGLRRVHPEAYPIGHPP